LNYASRHHGQEKSFLTVDLRFSYLNHHICYSRPHDRTLSPPLFHRKWTIFTVQSPRPLRGSQWPLRGSILGTMLALPCPCWLAY